MDLYLTDVDALLTHMKHADKQIKLKRRWLMGLAASKCEDQWTESLKFIENRCLPESLLREDDVFYETSKNHVQKAFCLTNMESDCHNFQDSMGNLNILGLSKELSSRIDDISNMGLYLLAKQLTKGHTPLDKTRWKLKKIVQEYLQRMKKCEGNDRLEEGVRISQVVTDPCFFRKGSAPSFISSNQSPSAKAQRVLDNLKAFPFHVLQSMYRKLKGESGKMLHSGTQRSGWNRDRLTDRVKRICESRLAEVERGDELPHSIAKAMAVTTLSMNLITRTYDQKFEDFYQFSPDIVKLQKNIMRAIWLINEKVRVSELRELQVLLCLNTNLPVKGLRSAIRNLLTVYLFECDDMDVIPKSLLDTLSVVNRNCRNVSQKCFNKEEINEDMECILGVSAQAKQIILDLLPDHSYDQEFSDAYMEDLQESESDESDVDDSALFEFDELPNNLFRMSDSAEPTESFGEVNSIEVGDSDIDPAIAGSNTLIDMEVTTEHTGGIPVFLSDSVKPTNTAVSETGEEKDCSEQSCSSNQYLRLQEACDETSLFAYNCVGHLLKECAQFQGLNLEPDEISYLQGGHSNQEPDVTKNQTAMEDDVGGMFICRVAEDLFPNMPNSVKAKLEEMMSLL